MAAAERQPSKGDGEKGTAEFACERRISVTTDEQTTRVTSEGQDTGRVARAAVEARGRPPGLWRPSVAVGEGSEARQGWEGRSAP